MEFLPDLKILMETGFARKPITKGKKEGELIGTSNLKVDFQESLDLVQLLSGTLHLLGLISSMLSLF